MHGPSIWYDAGLFKIAKGPRKKRPPIRARGIDKPLDVLHQLFVMLGQSAGISY